MTGAAEPPSFLQIAVRKAIKDSGRARDYYDKLIQQRTGKTGKVLHDIDRGKSKNPGIETLTLIADVLGKPISSFIPPKSQAPDSQVAPDFPPTKLASADDDTVDIITLDLRFPMGPGANIDDYIEEMPVRFSVDFIRSFTRTVPDRLRRASGVGDSMYPTLLSGDAVWIDTTQRMLNQQDRVWAISLYGAAAIKRLRAIGKGRILVISDNPDIPNQEVDEEDLMIGGRVIRLERDI